ncbi:bifunctional diguanylate cyclase/phosphodiesterase [Rubrivivax sp. JA1055]|uniref:putative bifunctional diguanylate cyclase/phosphodiesterase n=1 Tax=Rubrivivax sp. JA1055 TaxID=2894194 RepID=UPI001E29CEA2|nr:bifunctional diguanylate cyclase/phosphodiesterase [Rubrivivax sp. JA1055]MCC9596180.1 bifunctional diguanylate cyclase/phosphodiesterase [Rubrivivax sp. JA1055]
MLTPQRPAGVRFSLARALVIWGAVILAAIVLVALRLHEVAERHLEEEALRTARGWALQVGRVVPQPASLFGPAPAPRALLPLAGLRGTTAVYAFRLHAPDGRVTLASEGLPAAPAALARARVLDLVTGRSTHVVELQRQPDTRSAVHADVWLPVQGDGVLLGVAQVRVDLDESAAVTTRSAVRAASATFAGLLGVGLAGLLLWRAYARAERSARARIDYLDQHDPLTGALNRESFVAALRRAAARRAGHSAVLCMDLDRFREFNEWLGRGAGDSLLRQVAARLRATVRSGDLVARLGSDEFAVLADTGDAEALATLAQRIVEALRQPYDVGGRRCEIGASIGIALHGVDSREADRLLQQADLALARAKADGRGTFRFYDARLDDELQRRRRLGAELRDALAADALVLHFQPLMDAASGRIVGYEALARWPHAERGWVPPASFIPLAEQTGLIEDLGAWVLRAACREAARWPAPLSVAVNLSPAQFRRDGGIAEVVAEALRDSGLAPERLELEITESLLMARTEPVLRALRELRGLGVSIAMDDFGTGYSSLAHLWRFPLDRVKLDREFTHSLADDAKVGVIVGSVVSMAHALGMHVTAEGVETEAQRQALAAHGCDVLQGFLLGRPQPADRLPHQSADTALV